MAALTQSSKSGPGWKSETLGTLTASDTLTYFPGTGQELHLFNKTAGSLTPLMTGAAAVVQSAPLGGTVNYAAGIGPGALAVGAAAMVRLDDIPGYLVGTITITGGTGLFYILTGP